MLSYVYIWYITKWDVLPDGLYHQIGSITIALPGLGVLENRIKIRKPSKYENPQWKSWASKTSITCNKESQFLNFLSGGSQKTSRKIFSGKRDFRSTSSCLWRFRIIPLMEGFPAFFCISTSIYLFFQAYIKTYVNVVNLRKALIYNTNPWGT